MEKNKFYGIFSRLKISNLVKTQETRPHQGFLACESLWPSETLLDSHIFHVCRAIHCYLASH